MGGEEAAMRNYVIQRILATVPVMGVVVLFVFLLLRLAPGDPAALIAGDYATPEDIAKIRGALGLDNLNVSRKFQQNLKVFNKQ